MGGWNCGDGEYVDLVVTCTKMVEHVGAYIEEAEVICKEVCGEEVTHKDVTLVRAALVDAERLLIRVFKVLRVLLEPVRGTGEEEGGG